MKLFLKNILFTVFIPGSVGVYLPLWLARTVEGGERWWNWPGLLFLLAGAGVLIRCIWSFGKSGQGTPFPLDPPKSLVTGSLYQRSRNPMYVGVVSMIAGWAIWFGSLQVLFYGIAVWLVFHLFIVYYEEPVLAEQFGEPYQEYCNKVARWL